MNDILITKLGKGLKHTGEAALMVAEAIACLEDDDHAVAQSFAGLALNDLMRASAMIRSTMEALDTEDSDDPR
jgi:hypothetical protein